MSNNTHPIALVEEALVQVGLDKEKAHERAEDFIDTTVKKMGEDNTPDVEVQANSFDHTAGEIIITIHDTSSRNPKDVLEEFLNRYDKDPDKWQVKKKLKNTQRGDSYLAKPKPKSTGSSSSSKKTLAEEAEGMDAEEAEKLLNQLLEQSNG